jgi:hypothetical protein
MALLDNRLRLTFDYYKIEIGMVLSVPTAPVLSSIKPNI